MTMNGMGKKIKHSPKLIDKRLVQTLTQQTQAKEVVTTRDSVVF